MVWLVSFDVREETVREYTRILTSALATCSGVLIHSTSYPTFSMALARLLTLPAT